MRPKNAASARAASAAMRRLKVSDSHRFLVYEDGHPFFYLGDTAWELFHRLNREEAARCKGRPGQRLLGPRGLLWCV